MAVSYARVLLLERGALLQAAQLVMYDFPDIVYRQLFTARIYGRI